MPADRYQQMAMGGRGGGFTRLGLRLTQLFLSFYVVQLVVYHWIPGGTDLQYLALWPIHSGHFYWWQLITHPVMQDPNSPIFFLMELLTLWFFGAAVESRLGRTGFLILYFGAVYLAAIPGLLLTSVLPGLELAAFGGLMGPSLALIAAFSHFYRNANILLFFVLPVQAVWILIGTVAVIFLTFLAKFNPTGLYQLFTIGIGWLYASVGGGGPRRWWLKLKEWRTKRKLSQFQVIPGGRVHPRDDDIIYH